MLLRDISFTVWKFIDYKKYLIFLRYGRTGEIRERTKRVVREECHLPEGR